MGKLFGKLLGQYEQVIQSIARRFRDREKWTEAEIEELVERCADNYREEPQEVWADVYVSLARWAKSQAALERRRKSDELHRLFAEYRKVGESFTKFRRRYLDGEVEIEPEGDKGGEDEPLRLLSKKRAGK